MCTSADRDAMHHMTAAAPCTTHACAQVVAKYNVLFQYLLRLKRLQLALEDALGTLRLLRARDPAASARLRVLWNLRHNMAHAMANLQIYVQADVVEGRYGRLLEAVQAARDFGEAEQAHREFVDAALVQSFMDLRQIMALLEGIMSLCHRLCVMVQVCGWPTPRNCMSLMCRPCCLAAVPQSVTTCNDRRLGTAGGSCWMRLCSPRWRRFRVTFGGASRCSTWHCRATSCRGVTGHPICASCCCGSTLMGLWTTSFTSTASALVTLLCKG